MVDISQKRAKNIKNDEILSLDKSLASFFLQKDLSQSLLMVHTILPTELVQTPTVTLTHIMQKAFPPNWLMNYFESNWYSTIKIARYYLLRIICELCERVSKTAHLPTKPDQVAKAGILEIKPKLNITSLTLLKPKRKQNKEVKTSLLA